MFAENVEICEPLQKVLPQSFDAQSFAIKESTSTKVGVTVKGPLTLLEKLKLEVSATYEKTWTSETGNTYTFVLKPGQSKAVAVRARLRKRSGTWKEWDCSGMVGSGDWENIDVDEPKWEYEARDPS